MKKTYTQPTVELVKYEVEDVLLASGTGMFGFLAAKDEAEYKVTSGNAGWLE